MTCADRIRNMSNEDLILLFVCIEKSKCIAQVINDIVAGNYDKQYTDHRGRCLKACTCKCCLKEVLETEV